PLAGATPVVDGRMPEIARYVEGGLVSGRIRRRVSIKGKRTVHGLGPSLICTGIRERVDVEPEYPDVHQVRVVPHVLRLRHVLDVVNHLPQSPERQSEIARAVYRVRGREGLKETCTRIDEGKSLVADSKHTGDLSVIFQG